MAHAPKVTHPPAEPVVENPGGLTPEEIEAVRVADEKHRAEYKPEEG